MPYETKEFYDELWSGMDEPYFGPDETLVEHTKHLPVGRALEFGCGVGENAIWLAKQGWKVTAVDYSDVAIDKARKRAKDCGVDVEFVASDASGYQPEGRYDLVTSFYIQLPSESRAKMLAIASKALAPGGTLLFVSHDKAYPPPGWDGEDMDTLTTPEQVVSELPGLKIEQAYVKKDEGGAHLHGFLSAEGNESHAHDERHDHHDVSEDHEPCSTVVRAVKTT